MIELKGEIILVADLHFGINKFNIKTLKNQIKLFTKQIFPYMIKNNITTIFQFGDIFHNRTTADIIWFETLKREFFDIIQENNFNLLILKGNHDIALRESLDIALIDTIQQIYHKNITVFSKNEIIKVNNTEILVVPWITKDNSLKLEKYNVNGIFGHLEIQQFEMSKGLKDTSSILIPDYFKKQVDFVYSGHYHLKRKGGIINYLGTPFWNDWGDYNEEKGFYKFNGNDKDLFFIKNIVTKKYIKIKYNDDNKKPIEISGLEKNSIFYDIIEFKENISIFSKHHIKTFLNKYKDNKFEEMIYLLKQNNITTIITDNQHLSEIIGTNYITESIEELSTKEKQVDYNNSSIDLIRETIKNNKPEYFKIFENLLLNIDKEEIWI